MSSNISGVLNLIFTLFCQVCISLILFCINKIFLKVVTYMIGYEVFLVTICMLAGARKYYFSYYPLARTLCQLLVQTYVGRNLGR